MKLSVCFFLFAVLSFGAPPDVAVYPGAVLEEQATRSLRKANLENTAYNSTDSFDKVDAYYKQIGGQDVPHSRNGDTTMKFVVLRFPGKKFQVGLSWVAADKKHGTVIQLIQRP